MAADPVATTSSPDSGGPTAPRDRGTLADPRVRLPLLLFAVTLGLAALERLVLAVSVHDQLTRGSAADLLRAFAVGLRFDASVAATLLAPLVVVGLLLPTRAVASRACRVAALAYGVLTCALVVFLTLVDTFFFLEFHERLNHVALDYLGYAETWQLLVTDTPLVAAVAVSLLALVLAWRGLGRLAFPGGPDGAPRRAHFGGRLGVVLLVGLALRGTLDNHALNTSPAWFSDDPTLAQLALNGSFTLREAVYSRTGPQLDELLDLLPEECALALAADLVAGPDDVFLGHPDNPLRRITDPGTRVRDFNVVVVMMESMSWHYVGALGGDPRFSSHLDDLAADGLLMENCFAVGTRSSRGLAGVLCGFIDLPGRPVVVRHESEGRLFSLAHVLVGRGYETIFLAGGPANYDHMQAFLRSNGFSHLVFRDDMQGTFRTSLGWSDEDVFARAHEEFVAQGDRPFRAALLTSSFHRPHEIPPGRVEPVDPQVEHAAEMDSVRYADWAIGRFMERARTADYFARTIFVFVADHAGGFLDRPVTPAAHRIPFLVYAPEILGPQVRGRRVATVCSQADVSPTIMGLLGGRYEHTFLGSDVLARAPDQGRAVVLRSSDELDYVAANGDVVMLPFGSSGRLARLVPPGGIVSVPVDDGQGAARLAELSERAVALLQTAEILFRDGAYTVQPRASEPTALAGSSAQVDARR